MFKKISKSTVVIVSVIILFIAFIGGLVHYGNQYTEYEYQLNEMNDGVYAIYYTTHSRVPAQNYEVVTICGNGNVFTLRGNVYISFTDGKPYAKVKSFNMVNADEIYVYVPQGTVNYQESVNVGR